MGLSSAGFEQATDFDMWVDDIVGLGTHAHHEDESRVTFPGIGQVPALRDTEHWQWALELVPDAPAVIAAALVVEALRQEIVAAAADIAE